METETCDRCERELPYHRVTRQRDGEMLCSTCVNELNEAAREERKRQLAAAPRCEVASCNRRGTKIIGTAGVLLCGTHCKRAQSAVARQGIIAALTADTRSRENILGLAA